MKRAGYLSLTLRPGVATSPVPAHLDCLIGAARSASALDDGPVDRALARYGGGARYRLAFHARRSLGRAGEQHVGFDDTEERCGLSRTYQVQLGAPERAADAVRALRDLAHVESCSEQTLACAPLDVRARPVRAVSPQQVREPFLRVRAFEALAEEPGGRDVTVAVVDSGVIIGHPELQGRCLAGYDTVDLGVGRVNPALSLIGDSRGRDYNPYDDVGHGCLVAGIIGARGFRLPLGLCGRAMLLPIRVLAAARARSGKALGVGALPDIDAGLKIAVDLGADVINLSLGSAAASSADANEPAPHHAVVRYATDRGCVLIAAAGNSGKQERFFPAALPEVIAVGSVSPDGTRSAFSTWGAHVSLCAPGENIVGVARSGYQASSGTSFAAPFVSAVASLLVARARRRGAALTPRAVRQLLVQSARRLPGGPSRETGAGLLDACAALRALDRALDGSNEGRRPTRGDGCGEHG